MRQFNELSNTEVNKLLDDYDNNVAIKKIISSYDLDISPAKLRRMLPPKEFNDVTCPYCNRPMVAERKLRNSYSKEYTISDMYCPQCFHRCDNYCECNNCKEKAKRIAEEKINLIKETYCDTNRCLLNIDELSFEQKIYLGAICRMFLNEEMTIISSYERKTAPNKLTPNIDWTIEIYKELYEADVISVHPDSPLSAFDDDDTFPNRFNVLKACYYVNISKEDISTILNGNFVKTDDSFAENGVKLWKRIALNECIEYLIYQLNDVNFEFSAGNKTSATFDNLLDNFSVAQIYNIIWRAVADATKLYQSKKISRRQAANTTIGACQRYADNAILNSWKLKGYSRIKDLPQCELATFLYNKILKIGELGFNCVPGR